jgi:hypothetical protein
MQTVDEIYNRLPEIQLSTWHVVGDDSSLRAPTLGSHPILLDFTEDATFLQISKATLQPLKMHEDSDAAHATITLSIPEKWLDKMRALDSRLLELASPNGAMSLSSLLDVADGVDEDAGTELHCRLVLDHSEAPSRLQFLTDEGIKTGEGLEFLQLNLDGMQMEDLVCSCVVELQYIEKVDPYKGLSPDVLAVLPDREENSLGYLNQRIVVKVHDILFVNPPKLQIHKIPQDRLEALARAAKRMRVRM